MLRGVAPDGHLVLVDEPPNLVDVSSLQIRGVGMGPPAPQLDEIIAVFLCVLKAVLQGIALITGCKHTNLHTHLNLLLIMR